MGMKRNSNFAQYSARPVGRVTALVSVLCLATLAAAIWSATQVRSSAAELAQTEDHIARLSEQITTLSAEAESAPDAQALAAQAERIVFYNALTGGRAMGLDEVLALLERSLPADVWVSRLSYSVETGRLTLSVQTDVETALPPALRALERAPGLSGVILDRQVRLNQGGRQLLQYDVKAQAL